MKKKIGTIIGLAFFIVLILGFVLGIYFFGLIGIFELLGVKYTSLWSLIIFIISFFILGFIIEIFSKPISSLLTKKTTKKLESLFIEFNVQSLSNWLCIFIVDEFMTSITLSWETIIIIAVLLTLFEMAFEDRKRE